MVRVELTPAERAECEEFVVTERRGDIVVIRINRPDRRNALGKVIRQGLREAFDDFDADRSLRAAVLTGSGPVFCAGGDLKEMSASAIQVPPAEWDTIIGSNGSVSKPVIAAVNGPAFAGGFALAQRSDMVVAAKSAQFGITEVHRGRGAPWAAPLINMIPQKVMVELLLTGDPISAERAYEVGFVNRVVPDGELLDCAVALAERIAAGAPLSVSAALKMVYAAAELGASEAEAAANEVFESVYLSRDAQEGPRAYVERRLPVWSGE